MKQIDEVIIVLHLMVAGYERRNLCCPIRIPLEWKGHVGSQKRRGSLLCTERLLADLVVIGVKGVARAAPSVYPMILFPEGRHEIVYHRITSEQGDGASPSR